MGFTPLRIATIKAQKSLTFDLYIFFKEQYLKYIESGRGVENNLLEKLKVQKIAKFYIEDVSEGKYQKYLDEILSETLNDNSVPVEEKTKIVEGAANTAVERMQEDPESQANFKMAQSAVKSLRQIITDNPGALKAIFGKKVGDEDMIIKHCLNVSALCAKLGEVCGLNNQQLDDLVVAGLIHDLGVTKLPDDIRKRFFMPLKALSNDEKVEYRKHPDDSAAMISDKPWINQNIVRLVRHHEEKVSGQGPLKLKKLELDEEIISLVNCYDKKIIAEKMSPNEAIKDFAINELGNYSLETINKFKNVLKVQGILDLEA